MKGIVNDFALGKSAYAAPQCFVVEVFTEGLLCISNFTGGGYHGGIDGDDDDDPIINL